MRRKPGNIPKVIDADSPKSCEECAMQHKRVRCSLSLPEAKHIATTLLAASPGENHVLSVLGEYFQALVTVAARREDYEC